MKNDYQYWQTLTILAQSGDKHAYSKLLNELHIVIKRFVSKRVFNQNDVEDVVQNSLIGIHQSLHTYRSDQPFESWLFAIIRYKISDYLNGFKKDSVVNTNDSVIENTPAHHSGESDDKTTIHYALNQLSNEEKQLMIWLKIEQHSIKTVAKFLNKSESATKVMSHRAFKKLKAIMINDATRLIILVTFLQKLRIQ